MHVTRLDVWLCMFVLFISFLCSPSLAGLPVWTDFHSDTVGYASEIFLIPPVIWWLSNTLAAVSAVVRVLPVWLTSGASLW